MSKRLHNKEGIYNSGYIQNLEREYCSTCSAVVASSQLMLSSCGFGARVMSRIYEGGRRFMYTAAVGGMLLNNMAPAAMADTTVVSAGDISAGLGAGEGSDILVYGTTSNTALSGGRETVYSGGVANSTTVDFFGNQHISSGGVANDTIVSIGGIQNISSGGVANSATINGGYQNIYSGGVANDTVVNSFGYQTVYTGGVANSTTINGGTQRISSGGVANDTIVNSGGRQIVSSGGVANSATLNDGYQYVSSGGAANDTVVNNSGYQNISSGGVANDTVVNSGGRQSIYSGGSANDTIVSNGGYQTVYTGGVANSTKIYSKGNQVISSGGVANDTIVSSGGIQNIYSGGSANDTVVKALGYQIVSSGGSANSSIINERGRQNISSGGVANDTVVNTYGYQYVYDGVANDTVVNELGFQMVFSGGSANNAIVSSGGIQNIYFGGVANGTTLNGGEQYVSRGVANDTVVNTSGIQVVYSGGSANNTIVSSGGRQNIYFGGMANNTHIKPNGELILRGGVANALQAEGGLISVIDTSYLSGYTNMINGTQIVFAESTPDAKLSMENLDANQLNIKMNVNLEEQTGNVLYIEQGFRGNAEIELNNTAASAAPTEGEGIRLVDFGSSGYMEEGAIYLKGGQWDDGGYIYNLFQGGMSSAGMDYDYYLRSTGKYSDLFKTMLNIPLMNVMIARTGMNSRLGDLRDMDNQGKKHGIWVRSYYKDLTVNDLTETDMNLFGVEAGYDWLFRADEPTKLYAGVMLGYIKANDIKTAKENGGYDTGDGESPSVGVYATLVDDSRWFVDIAARNFWTKLDMTNYSAAGNILSYEPKRNVIAASVEGGKSFLSPVKGGGFFKIEPKVELTYMRASSDSASVQGGVGDLSYDAGDYLNAKAAVLFGYTIKRGNGLLIEPLVELAYRYEFLGKNDVYYGGAQKESDIGGSVGEANIGLNMQLTKDLYWYALGGYE